MSTPRVIGLTGYATAGKDLVGALLAMRNYRRIAFADAVRMEVSDLVIRRATPPHELDEDLRAFLGRIEVTDVWAKPTGSEMRRILQQWGTEYRRAQDEDYWIRIADDRLKALGDLPAVITDMRFQNECEWIRSIGGVVWRVNRSGLKTDGHASETALESIQEDRVISNDGDLQYLAANVIAALG